MADLTKFYFKQHGATFDIVEGDLVSVYQNGQEHILPRTHIVMTLSDGFAFRLETAFLGELRYTEHCEDGYWITGEDKARSFLNNKILPAQQVNLEHWGAADTAEASIAEAK